MKKWLSEHLAYVFGVFSLVLLLVLIFGSFFVFRESLYTPQPLVNDMGRVEPFLICPECGAESYDVECTSCGASKVFG